MDLEIKQTYMSNIDTELKKRVNFLLIKDAEEWYYLASNN